MSLPGLFQELPKGKMSTQLLLIVLNVKIYPGVKILNVNIYPGEKILNMNIYPGVKMISKCM